MPLRIQVVEEEKDDPLLFKADAADRPPLKSDFRDGQQALFFHRQATKVLRLRAQMKEELPVTKTVEEKMAEEEAGIHVMQAMQEGGTLCRTRRPVGRKCYAI